MKPDEVHVWRVGLNVAAESVEVMRMLLSRQERERAGRFRFVRDQRQFVVAHAALRSVLSQYLGCDPVDLSFELGYHGKPYLSGKHRTAGLQFNLSHTDGLALLAVARMRRVGVDVEAVKPELGLRDLAKGSFSRRELAALEQLPESDRCHGYFRCWTRKEAYIKGRGEGLQVPLRRFSVSLEHSEPARLLETEFDPRDVQSWELWDIQLGQKFAGAIAVEGVGLLLSIRDFDAGV